MFSSHVPKYFWGEAVLIAAYLMNTMASRVLKFQSPYQVLLQTFSHIKFVSSNIPTKIFGCSTFVHVENNQERIGGKNSLCIFFIELTCLYIQEG